MLSSLSFKRLSSSLSVILCLLVWVSSEECAERKVLHRARNNMFLSCQPEPAFFIIFNNLSRPQKIFCCININSEYIKRKNRTSLCKQNKNIYLFLLHSFFFIHTLNVDKVHPKHISNKKLRTLSRFVKGSV